jgi:class 3 adenylate cyclase/ABC-type oligopeptide transport system substrate-binding subunit
MSPQQTSGVATVMFTDLEASTDTTTRLGDDAAAAFFATHDRIVREQFEAHGGRRVKSTGDGFLALFDSARSAIACALAIQRDLAAQEDGPRVRIGINAGEVREHESELFGAAINLAARVMDRAAGGEILVTDTVRQLAGTMPAVRFRDRGRVALKGFPERQRLHHVRAADAQPAPRLRAPRRSSRRPALAAALLAVAAAAAAAIVLVTAGDEKAVHVRPNSVAIIDPDDAHVIEQVPVGVRPTEVVAGGGSVFVANTGDSTVTQIGARSHRVAGTITPGMSVDGLGAGPSGVWVADNASATAASIDPDFRTVATTVRTGAVAGGPAAAPVAVTADAAWIASSSNIARVDRRSGRRIANVVVGNSPSGVAAGAGGVWVSDDIDGTLRRIDPQTNEVVATIAVGQSASGVAVGAGGVWVPVPFEDRVKRIDPATEVVTDIVPVNGAPAAVTIGAGAVWVSSRRNGIVTRIDPDSARVTRTIRLGNSPQGIAVADGAVWVALQATPPRPASAGGGADVLRVLWPVRLWGGTDPALGGNAIQYATCAQLFNYPDRPFPAGAQLEPEVAAAMPSVSDGGRTHTIRVRSGFRFSPPSNAPVTAESFARVLERGLNRRSESYAAYLMRDIVGAADYTAGRAKHIAGVTAHGDTLTIRLTAPSLTLPARLASIQFCAVPPTTPISASGVQAIPMAGPYYIASEVPKRRLVLRRNPNYHGDRPARLREIDFDLEVTAARAAAAVEAGRADYLPHVPVERVAELDRRYGPRSAAARAGRQRYFSGTLPILNYFVFNTHRPLFAATRMRQAVNTALDRRALAARLPLPPPGGRPGRPTDQFIPPGTPGFRDAAIYPLGAPDLTEARRLAGSGRRRTAVLITCDFRGCLEHGRVVRRNLAAIGIDVEVKNLPFEEMFTRLKRPGEPWDLGYFNWFPDFVDPSDFFKRYGYPDGPFVGGFFRAGQLQRRIRPALRLDGKSRADAFARIDAEAARAAVAVPFATESTTDFFSDRIGCQVNQPIYGISLGALCIRR